MTKSERIAILEEKINDLEDQLKWQKEIINRLMCNHQGLGKQPYQPNIPQPLQPWYYPVIDPNGTARPIWDSGFKVISTNASDNLSEDVK